MANNELSKIWSHARIYGLGTIINQAAGLVLIPIYTHVLSPDEYGVYAIIIVAGEMASIFLSRGFSTAMVRIFLDSESEKHRAEVTSTVLLGFSVLAFCVGLLAKPIAYWASFMFFETDVHWQLFQYAFYVNILSLIFNLELDYFRASKKPWAFLWLSTAKSFFMFALNILFVVYFKMGVIGIIYGTLLSICLVAVPTYITLLFKLGTRVVPKYLFEVFKIGIPMVPSKIADLTTQFTDKYFINLFLLTSTVGTYALAHRLSSLLQIFIASPFAQIWIVRRLELLNKNSEEENTAFIFSLFLAVMTAGGLFISLYALEIVTLISAEEFKDTAVVVPLLSLGFILMPIDMNFQLGIIHLKKTYLLIIPSFAAAISNVFLMYFLTGRLGVYGAAMAFILTNLVRILVTILLNLKFCQFSMCFQWGRSFLIIISAILCYLMAFYTVDQSINLHNMGMKFLAFLVYLLFSLKILWSSIHASFFKAKALAG